MNLEGKLEHLNTNIPFFGSIQIQIYISALYNNYILKKSISKTRKQSHNITHEYYKVGHFSLSLLKKIFVTPYLILSTSLLDERTIQTILELIKSEHAV